MHKPFFVRLRGCALLTSNTLSKQENGKAYNDYGLGFLEMAKEGGVSLGRNGYANHYE